MLSQAPRVLPLGTASPGSGCKWHEHPVSSPASPALQSWGGPGPPNSIMVGRSQIPQHWSSRIQLRPFSHSLMQLQPQQRKKPGFVSPPGRGSTGSGQEPQQRDGAGNPNKPLLISCPQHKAFLKGEMGISSPSPPKPPSQIPALRATGAHRLGQCQGALRPRGEEGTKQVTASLGCRVLVHPTGDPRGLG